MNDCFISPEVRQTKLMKERQRIRDNMIKKHVQNVKPIQSTDNHIKTSKNIPILDCNYDYFYTDDNMRVTTAINQNKLYETIYLNEEDTNVSNEIMLYQLKEVSCVMVDGIRDDVQYNGKNDSDINIHDAEQNSVDDNIEEWSFKNLQKSLNSLSSLSQLSVDLKTTLNLLDKDHLESDNGSLTHPMSLDEPEDKDHLKLEKNQLALSVNVERFVKYPPSKGHIVKCLVTRDQQGLEKGIFPIYYLHLERSGHSPIFLLAARRRKLSKTSNFLISCDAMNLKRDGEGFIAKVRSNFVGTQFTMFDNGESVKLLQSGITKPLRKEIAAIIYEANVLGFKGPRKMTVVVPSLTEEDIATEFNENNGNSSLIEGWQRNNTKDLIVLQNKSPVWNKDTKTYALNFRGRKTRPSVKNFQLISENHVRDIIMQFVRTSYNAFSMDYSYPLTALQAFGIALTSLDGKVACE